jgi:hypothetical protein
MCHHVNATGGNGCASSETVCFTIHGILHMSSFLLNYVIRVSPKNSDLGLLSHSISENLKPSMAIRHEAACFGWPSGQEMQ